MCFAQSWKTWTSLVAMEGLSSLTQLSRQKKKTSQTETDWKHMQFQGSNLSQSNCMAHFVRLFHQCVSIILGWRQESWFVQDVHKCCDFSFHFGERQMIKFHYNSQNHVNSNHRCLLSCHLTCFPLDELRCSSKQWFINHQPSNDKPMVNQSTVKQCLTEHRPIPG